MIKWYKKQWRKTDRLLVKVALAIFFLAFMAFLAGFCCFFMLKFDLAVKVMTIAMYVGGASLAFLLFDGILRLFSRKKRR